nr:GATA transcription factor 19-like [Ipomoea batatas]
MMHRCSSSCSCGMYNQSSNDYSAGFSMFFSSPPANQNHHHQYYYEEAPDYDQNIYSSSSSSVDCTLSLGTPSTRLTSANERPPSESRRSLSSSSHKSGRGGAAASDPLVTRRCANCDTTSTPLWRNGPRGPKVQINLTCP